MRRKQRDLTGAPYYDATFYSGNNLARLPEALRPKPGRLTNAQQRVYEVQTPFVPISLLQSALPIVY
jgi:CCR4-NOT transcription complex subunit 1